MNSTAPAHAAPRTVTTVVPMRAQDIQVGDAVPRKTYSHGAWSERGWVQVARVERTGDYVGLHSAKCDGQGQYGQPCRGSNALLTKGCRSDHALDLVQVQVPTEVLL